MKKDKKYNVCIVSDFYSPYMSGLELSVIRQANELCSRGHKVTVLASTQKKLPKIEKFKNLTIYRFRSISILKKSPTFRLAFPLEREVKHILLKEKIDLIHFHLPSYLTYITYKASKKLKMPTVTTMHFQSLNHMTLNIPWAHNTFIHKILLEKIIKLSERTKAMIFPSKNLMGDFKKMAHSSRYVPNPVDSKFFKKYSKKNSSNNKTIFFAGRLMKEKNIAILLKAMPDILQQIPDTHLIISGEGYLNKSLIQLAQNLNISKSVTFTGMVKHDQMPSLYQQCDIFVLPSFYEAQPLVLLEAMASSKALIVSSSILSASELVKENKNGFLFNPTDKKELAEKIITLLKNKKLREQFGRESYKMAQEFTLKKSIDKLENIYQEILS
ncbi:MAG: glycosyltransferase family 4 protein [Candidatus Woesearchaeota archaeon]|nr:glycosyltransferase family 4 protein [Candidatus Woesearchaeota archaeon]